MTIERLPQIQSGHKPQSEYRIRSQAMHTPVSKHPPLSLPTSQVKFNASIQLIDIDSSKDIDTFLVSSTMQAIADNRLDINADEIAKKLLNIIIEIS